MSKRARDHGLICGRLPPGPLNAITDVAEVRVGHRTLSEADVLTGFTAVLPHGGDLFREKVRAGVEVINGFGKSAGLMQVAELGQIETPILLGNTFSVAAGIEALVGRALGANAEIGRSTGTVNALVLECNDGFLSDIRRRCLTIADAEAALDAASGGSVEEGSVGAGAGMSAFGFKGGIGTASRVIGLDTGAYTVGVLVQANFGNAGDLVLPDGRRPLPPALAGHQPPERGSVIIVLSPLPSRQPTGSPMTARATSCRCASSTSAGSIWPSARLRRRHRRPSSMPCWRRPRRSGAMAIAGLRSLTVCDGLSVASRRRRCRRFPAVCLKRVRRRNDNVSSVCFAATV
ncbi:MAG: D-aminopeptidase [Xanthobacteraceae bacterium]|nr:MAG: D-aminopeptidase [Xanthobacteraceae bacterium]